MEESQSPNPQPNNKYESNPFKLIFRGLDRLFKHNKPIAIALLIVSVLSTLGDLASGPSDRSDRHPGSQVSDNPFKDIDPSAVLLLLGLFLLAVAVVWVIGLVIWGFLSYVGWKTSREEKTTFGEAVRAVMSKIGTLWVLSILVGLKTIGGLILFVVPGIRAALRYQLVLYPVFEENLKARAAMDRIKFITKDHLVEIFGMSIAAALIPFMGMVLEVGGESQLYPQLRQLKDSNSSKPPVHWLNYLAFILIPFIALVVGAIFLFVKNAS